MKILFTPTLNAPSVFYRMEQFVNYLRSKDHEVAFTHRGPDTSGTCLWEHNIMDMKDEMSALWMEADVIVSQIVHTRMALALMALLRDKYQKPLLVELDDDPYSKPHAMMEGHGVTPGGQPELWGDEFIRMADGVICSTEHIKERVLERWPDKTVHVVPNCINFEIYDPLPRKVRKRVVAGWVGGANHIRDLKILRYIIPELPKVRFHTHNGAPADEALEFRNCKQTHMCTKEESVRNLKNVTWWKSILEYPKFLASCGFSIGLFPLCDTAINRSKSNLRWLEFTAVGTPTVASRVRPYTDSILHGETGFLCDSVNDWIESIGTLADDAALREKMARAAEEQVREKFSLPVVGARYEQILEEYANGSVDSGKS